MHHKRWTQFVKSIDHAFKATVSLQVLLDNMSAVLGENLTAQQLDYLQSMDTDVFKVGENQYALGWYGGVTRLHQLIRPLPADPVVTQHPIRMPQPEVLA